MKDGDVSDVPRLQSVQRDASRCSTYGRMARRASRAFWDVIITPCCEARSPVLAIERLLLGLFAIILIAATLFALGLVVIEAYRR